MKKLKFISSIALLFLLTIVVSGQDPDSTAWADVPFASQSNDVDQFTVLQPGGVAKMTSGLLLQDVNDAIDALDTEFSNVTSHPSNTSNPHSVTDAQVLPSMTGNSGKNFTNDGTSSLWSGNVTVDTVYLEGGGKIYADAIGNLILDDLFNPPQVLSDLIGGSGTGTVTSILPGLGMDFSTISSTGYITLGNPTTLSQSSVNQVTATGHTHDLAIANFNSSMAGFVPQSGGGVTNFLRADGAWAAPSGSDGSVSKIEADSLYELTADAGVHIEDVLIKDGAINLGTSSRVNFNGGQAFVYDNYGNLTFRDNATGIKTLGQLAAGGGSNLGDTIPTLWNAVFSPGDISDYVYTYEDSLVKTIALSDSRQFKTGTYMVAIKNWEKDTIQAINCYFNAYETGTDIEYNFAVSASSIYNTGNTNLWTADVTATDAGGATGAGDAAGNPDNPYLLPGEFLLLEFTVLTDAPSNGGSLNFVYRVK